MNEFDDQLPFSDDLNEDEQALQDALEERNNQHFEVQETDEESGDDLREALKKRDEDAERLDRQADKLGSIALAHVREGNFPSGTTFRQRPKANRRRSNRRGGRSYPEPSGRDRAREIANQEPELSDEEKREITRGSGHAFFQEQKAKLFYEQRVKEANGDSRELAILQRQMAEDKK